VSGHASHASFLWRRVSWLALACLIGLILARPSSGLIAAPPSPGTDTPTPTPTTVPFLQPPFARIPYVTSYFDHHYPDYVRDDTIVLFNGRQASAIDGIEGRLPTFPGGYLSREMGRYLYYDGHTGFDYGTGAGMTVLAAAPGEVVIARTVPSSCATPLQYVCVEHPNGYRTYYLHLEGIVVRKGQWVQAGDPLGISGNSGCSFGAHLHFAVEYDGALTDPYGWRAEGVPDPLIEHTGAAATWLWGPDQPLAPLGRLIAPQPGTRTNGELRLAFEPTADSPPIERVAFLAYYGRRWHPLGEDAQGADGWTFAWDTRAAPEGEAWLHAWAIGADGRVGKGSPIVQDVIVDRQPPQGFIIGLRAEDGAAQPVLSAHAWLYAASYDPESGTQQVTFLAREVPDGEWREVGDGEWLHGNNWALEWETDLLDGAHVDVRARLTDRAGNVSWTEPVTGLVARRSRPRSSWGSSRTSATLPWHASRSMSGATPRGIGSAWTTMGATAGQLSGTHLSSPISPGCAFRRRSMTHRGG